MIELPICDNGSHLDPAWNTCVRILGPNDILPIPTHLDTLYLDFETTSENPYKSSINPHSESLTDNNLHRDCKIAGVAFLFDNEPIPYYIPVRHYYLDDDEDMQYRTDRFQNVDIARTHDWLKAITNHAKVWMNHNLKYDYHVLYNETRHKPKCKLVCSVVLSKLAGIVERMEYGLTSMMREIGIDITPYELQIKQFLGKKYRDYALIPPDHCGIYAAVDVLSVRELRRFCEQNTSTSQRVIDLEHSLLPMLIQMEQIGCRVDIDRLTHDWKRINKVQAQRIARIKHYSGFLQLILSGEGSKNSQYEMFVEHLGWNMSYTDTTLKKLERGEITEQDTEELAFSFGYDSVFKHFRKNKRLVSSYLAYKDDDKLLNSYVVPYMTTHVSGRELIHCNVNQQVRTGRMSVTSPGMQTLPPKAKYYIIPYTDDYVLVEFDLSQIEFRMIVHYINNRAAINAYNRDPTTDFHTWVAQMTGIDRKPAKNVNFMLGYGGGREKCVKMLSQHPKIVGELKTQEEIVARAYQVYTTYHNVLPELKPTSYLAGNILKARGFVRTLFGRERHLPRQFFFKAFNSVSQGSAADVAKDITRRLQKFISVDCLLHLIVHDSWLFSIRRDRVNELVPEIKHEIERPLEGVEFSVPIACDIKSSDKSWGSCKKWRNE